MMRALTPALLTVLLTGCGVSGVEGTLKDNAGNALGEVTLTLEAVGAVGMTCQKFGGPTDVEGNFKIDGVCVSQSEYTVKTSDDSLWLAETATVPLGHSGPVNLVATPHGGGPGVYLNKGTEVTSLKTGGDIKEDVVGETKFNYLAKVGTVTVLPAADKLLVNGAEKIDGNKFKTLSWVPGPLKVGTEEAPLEIAEGAGLWVIGGALTAEAFTAGADVAPDAAKLTTKEHADVKVTWIGGDALPAGRYVYYAEGDRRPLVLDFGQALPDPTVVAAPE